jgi:Fe2+ transport system protein FeoA
MSDDPDTTLDRVAPGAMVVVRQVGGARPVALRLMEMGLLAGTPVEVVRVAPMGDPIELRLRGYSLSIRRAQAREVRVSSVVTAEAAE